MLSNHCANSAETCDSSFAKISNNTFFLFLKKAVLGVRLFWLAQTVGATVAGTIWNCFFYSGSLALYITTHAGVHVQAADAASRRQGM